MAEEYKDSFDPQIDFIVGAMLTMYANKNINNNSSYIIDEEKNVDDFTNEAYQCVQDLKPMMDDIAASKLRGSRFIHLSRFWEDWNNRPISSTNTVNGENPAMLELRDVIAPKILGFQFYKWYMMKNENFGYPYFLDSDFLDLSGGEPTALATIWNTTHSFVTLKEFKDNIDHEYTGDFKEFDKQSSSD